MLHINKLGNFLGAIWISLKKPAFDFGCGNSDFASFIPDKFD